MAGPPPDPMPTHHATPAPEVRVLPTAEECAAACLEELRRTVAAARRPLVSFATGNTFAPFFAGLARALEAGRPDPEGFVATHLDEYLGFGPEDPGGMVHELVTACPPLRDKLSRGSFLPVPGDGDEGALAAHAGRLERAGGIALQLVGIGRNGHLAFNEPGSAPDGRFRRVRLAESTRDDARGRFAPGAPPREAVTAGLADILDARRVVLVATGAGKALAVRHMLEGEVGPACPASLLRGHPDTLVLLDPAAAGQ